MKNLKSIFAAIIVIAILFTSCKKDEMLVPQKPIVNTSVAAGDSAVYNVKVFCLCTISGLGADTVYSNVDEFTNSSILNISPITTASSSLLNFYSIHAGDTLSYTFKNLTSNGFSFSCKNIAISRDDFYGNSHLGIQIDSAGVQKFNTILKTNYKFDLSTINNNWTPTISVIDSSLVI